MSAAGRLAFLCLLCVAVAACGGGGSSASNRTQIMNMFSGLESAMAHGHYATACNHFSAREQSQIVAGAKKAGLSSVSTCSDAFGQLITETDVLVREDGSWRADRTIKRTPSSS